MECNYFQNKRCISCKNLSKGYETSVSDKVDTWINKVKDLYPDVLIKDIVKLSRPELSRNKAKFVVAGTSEKPVIGIPKIGNVKEVESLENCPLHLEGINEIAKYLKSIIRDYNLTPYNVELRKGELKLLIIYKSQSTGECFVRFILRSKESLDRLKKAVPIIQEFFPEIKVISANIQPKPMAAMEGEEEIFLTSNRIINNLLNDIHLPITTKGFFQVSSEIAQKLYGEVAKIVSEEYLTNVLDLFCGVGGFSNHIAKKCKSVKGVELSASAIECANISKSLNRNNNVEFIAKDAFEYLVEDNHQFDGVIVNPPRRGLGKKVVELILEQRPKLIIYSSCNPDTFLKDISLMKGYSLESIRPFDMFAYSDHLEVLGVLRRENV